MEAFPAKHRAPLRRTERNRGLFSALRACGLGFCPRLRRPASSASLRSFRLARLTTFRFVLESLVGEKHLFAGGEHKLGTTLRALQDPIVVFHEPLPLGPQAGSGDGLILHRGLFVNLDLYSGNAGHGSLGPVGAVNVRIPKTSLPDRGLIPEVRRPAASRSGS